MKLPLALPRESPSGLVDLGLRDEVARATRRFSERTQPRATLSLGQPATVSIGPLPVVVRTGRTVEPCLCVVGCTVGLLRDLVSLGLHPREVARPSISLGG